VNLKELQSLFQAAVLAGDEEDAAVLGAVAAQGVADKPTKFGVYVGAYRIRLAEYLDEDYPTLRALVGDDVFEALEEEYIAANPSRDRNARWYASRLPEFMQQHDEWRLDRPAIGMALFERALTDAFDAADTPALSIETLADFSPEDWPRLRFRFHPSFRLLEVAAGTLDAYIALNSDQGEEAPLAGEGLEAVAVWRSNHDPLYRGLDADEFLALNEARAGQSFGEICQMVAFQNEDQPAAERLAQFLVSWFSEGLVTGAESA
jgi:hypothetical protein